jgi:release factor glutamine methyltransferase
VATIPYRAAIKEAATRLLQAGVDDPRREARLLAHFVLGIDSNALPPRDTPVDAAAYRGVVARRAAREPLAFITGRRAFWSFEVEVSPATLIPRPDSETLIEAAIGAHPARTGIVRILDLGTGTGCLLLAALLEFPAAFGVGVDRVPQAAALAARNAGRIAPNRAAFLVGDWAEALGCRFDLVLANPPYIPAGDIEGLMQDVAAHEPATALDGGPTGLTEYARLIPALPSLLNPGATAVFELGVGLVEPAMALARGAGFTSVHTTSDLSGIPRALVLHAFG